MSRKRAEIIVKGVVHDVGFRFFTLTHARALSLDGSVSNIAGGVRVIAEGESGAISALIEEIRVGPRFAHVTNLEIKWLKPENLFEGFTIIH